MNEDNDLPSGVAVPFGKLSSDLIRSGLYRVVIRYSREGTFYSTFPFFRFPIWFFLKEWYFRGISYYVVFFFWLVDLGRWNWPFLFTCWELGGFHAGSFQPWEMVDVTEEKSSFLSAIPCMLDMGTLCFIFFLSEACLVFPSYSSTWFIRTAL